MPLVSMKEMLIDAKENGYAVGQYNLNNLEFTQAILEASQEENAPVILGVSEGAARYMSGFYTVVKMVEGLMHDLNITIPVAIQLDYHLFYMVVQVFQLKIFKKQSLMVLQKLM